MQASFEQYAEVALGLKACLRHMGPWSVGDLTLGLRHVGARHNAHDISDNLPGWPLTCPPAAEPRLFEWLEEESRIACSAYVVPDAAAIAAESRLPAAAVAAAHTAAARFQPAHYVAVDEAAHLVRVVVRGTTDVHDVLTDLAGHVVAYGDTGHSVHAGFLQAGEWLLGQVAVAVGGLLEAHPGYGLRLSGHSLGAGTAAVACDLLRRTPGRWPAISAHVEPRRVSCFALAPPPIFSLPVARAARVHTTSLVTGHDIVARASLANFEQLRLEVLASGWWDSIRDAAQRSAVARRVTETLTAAGAGALTLLARAGGRGEGMQASLDSLHHLYVAPTAEPQAHEKARQRAQAQVSAALGAAMHSYRESTRAVTHQALDGVAALAKMRPHEWWQAAYSGVSAASAALGGQHGGGGAGAGAGANGAVAKRPRGGGAASAGGQPTSSWAAFGAAAMATASGLASTMAQAAADAGARHDRAQGAGAQHGGGGDAQRGKKKPVFSEYDLKHAVHAHHLYCPGRLLHLQRRGAAEGEGAGALVSAGARHSSTASADSASSSASGGRKRKKVGLEAALAGAQRFVLVDGEPADARFEFIAVRSTMISDHLIPTTLLALQSLRRNSGGSVDLTDGRDEL